MLCDSQPKMLTLLSSINAERNLNLLAASQRYYQVHHCRRSTFTVCKCTESVQDCGKSLACRAVFYYKKKKTKMAHMYYISRLCLLVSCLSTERSDLLEAVFMCTCWET